MPCKLGICACSPYTLILGRLAFSPTPYQELYDLARQVYDESSCWSLEDYRVVFEFLRYSGMVKSRDGLLYLDLEDPFDREYAELAKRALAEAGLIAVS